MVSEVLLAALGASIIGVGGTLFGQWLSNKNQREIRAEERDHDLRARILDKEYDRLRLIEAALAHIMVEAYSSGFDHPHETETYAQSSETVRTNMGYLQRYDEARAAALAVVTTVNICRDKIHNKCVDPEGPEIKRLQRRAHDAHQAFINVVDKLAGVEFRR